MKPKETPTQDEKISEFIKRWNKKGKEEQHTQTFWIDLLRTVLNVENPLDIIEFEHIIDSQIKDEHRKRADAYLPETKVIIEQKSLGTDLNKRYLQSDGKYLKPVEQAYRYGRDMRGDERPKYIVVSNFSEFWIYDFERIETPLGIIRLRDLKKESRNLLFLISQKEGRDFKEQQISLKAGKVIAELYKHLNQQYASLAEEETEKLDNLNMLCVRIVFCLYCEDAGIFENNQFLKFLTRYQDDPIEVSYELEKLFKVLDTPIHKRPKNLPVLLRNFPYVNGDLFAQHIKIPPFNDEIVKLLLNDASRSFDWSDISPAIFGAVFEQTLNPEQRRQSGMHYTSVKNIKKVIGPLFLDELKEELDEIINHDYDLETWQGQRAREKRLIEYIDKLASLKFLDPACGSGNFLTQTYIELRRLENKALKYAYGKQQRMDVFNKVSLSQFYGIEINGFAVAVAQTALWIAESQMNKETAEVLGHPIDFLPLKSYPNIKHANALRMDWNDLVPSTELSFIMGNPPFVGASHKNNIQVQDMDITFSESIEYRKLDYVCAWFYKAAHYMKDTDIEAAFVSTNSIVQGESVGILWKYLREQGITINFAYQSFIWSNETKDSAQVHCVIIGFSMNDNHKPKLLMNESGPTIVDNINGYLHSGPWVFITKRYTPLSPVPRILKGNQPTDNGELIFSNDEKERILNKNPNLMPYLRRYIGAQDFIHNKYRYCLWLLNAEPNILRIPDVYKRLKKVQEFRLSRSNNTRKVANTPHLFQAIRYKGEGNYLLIPRHTSENRKYIPIGFIDDNSIPSDAVSFIKGEADLYYFGVLTSNVHNAWMRTVAGRLEMRYRYSNTLVYNNFPWPEPTKKQKQKIEETAKAILDARALYPDCSLADLYDDLTMPPELRIAHEANDRAVIQAYGWKQNLTDNEIVENLMKMYAQLTQDDK